MNCKKLFEKLFKNNEKIYKQFFQINNIKPFNLTKHDKEYIQIIMKNKKIKK